MEVDEETRSFFDRLLRDGAGIRQALEAYYSSTNEKIENLRDEMLTNFDALFKRDEDRQTEYQAIKAALSRVEISEVSIDARVAALEAALRGDHDA